MTPETLCKGIGEWHVERAIPLLRPLLKNDKKPQEKDIFFQMSLIRMTRDDLDELMEVLHERGYVVIEGKHRFSLTDKLKEVREA